MMRIGKTMRCVLCYLLEAEKKPKSGKRPAWSWRFVAKDVSRDYREIVEEGLKEAYTESNRVRAVQSMERLLSQGLVEKVQVYRGPYGKRISYWRLTDTGRKKAMELCTL